MGNLPHNQPPNEFLHQLGELLRASAVIAAQKEELEDVTQQNLEQQAMIGFGEYLIAARTQQHLSPSEFACLIGTTEAYIHALEQGLLPRKAVGDHLLARIATVLGDECEILTIILGDAVTVAPAFTVFNELSSCSKTSHGDQASDSFSLSRKHRHGKQQVVGNWQGLYRRGFAHLLPMILWTNLQVSRYRNLLDRLQASRLTSGQIAPKRTIVMVTACCFIALWIGTMASSQFGFVGRDEGEVQTSITDMNQLSATVTQPTIATVQNVTVQNTTVQNTTVQIVTVQQHSLRTPSPILLEGATFVDHSDVTTTAMLPISIVPNAYAQDTHGQQRSHQIVVEENLAQYPNKQLGSNLDRHAYRIVYTERNATKQYTVPYIVVNEEQVALIQFQIQKKTPPSQHCISSGRFDLCPI